MIRKTCHEILDQIDEKRLEDVLKTLTEIRDRPSKDYAAHLDGIPVLDMSNPEHIKRILNIVCSKNEGASNDPKKIH